MTFEAGLTLGVISVAIVLLVLEVLSPDIVLLGALAVLASLDIMSVEEALAGFAEPTLVAIGALFVIAAGLRSTGVLRRAADLLFGTSERLWSVLVRLSVASGISSAFLNNTPIVAMGIPAVMGWTRGRPFPVSKLLIPLSYASILGGICTLIGTSTNLVADGLLRADGQPGLGFFELGMVGLPLALVGIAYLVLVAPRLLPDRTDVVAGRRASLIHGEAVHILEVPSESPAVGVTVREAGLNTPDLALSRVIRASGEVVAATPSTGLRKGDRLAFRGDPAALDEALERLELERVEMPRAAEMEGPFELREAVIPEGSVLDDERVGDVHFPSRYGAAVVGVLRHGVEMTDDTEHVILRPGDVLLLAASEGFTETFRGSKDFYLVGSEALEEEPEAVSLWRPTAAKAGFLILGAVILVVTAGILHIALAALAGAVAMVAFRLVSPLEARRSVDWSVLLVIGAAIGLGNALTASGAAELVAGWIVAVAEPLGPVGVLGATLAACMVFTLVITNNAAVALLFPVAVSTAASQGLAVRPFVVAITIGASLAFATPMGYQTNLMVYGPGGYRFRDFVKAGLPLQILLGILAAILIPIFWPLR